MKKIYSECNVTWASIENYIPYSRVFWSVCKNGIPVYTFFDKDGKKIDINDVIEND